MENSDKQKPLDSEEISSEQLEQVSGGVTGSSVTSVKWEGPDFDAVKKIKSDPEITD
jgi:hypothetical protein